MSSFLCSDAQTFAVAAYAEKAGLGDALQIARALRALNNRGQLVRYGDPAQRLGNTDTGLSLARALVAAVDASTVCAWARCLGYQCDTVLETSKSKGATVLRALLARFEADGVEMADGVWQL